MDENQEFFEEFLNELIFELVFELVSALQNDVVEVIIEIITRSIGLHTLNCIGIERSDNGSCFDDQIFHHIMAT